MVISYNVLNLPSSVATAASGSLTYTYLSDGTKVSAIKSDGSGERYLGSFVYSVPSSGSESLESAAWDEGRINYVKTGNSYTKSDLWFVNDHLGNVRTIVDISTGLSAPQVLERNDYLPFGTRLDAGTAVIAGNRFRLGGKESQTFGSIDLGKVDFGARMYDPFTARWMTSDPMATKYGSMSPYNYCGGNPIGIIDNGGLDLILAGKNNSSVTFKTNLIDKKFSVASLGIDWKGNYTLEGNDLLSAGLDLVGIADPTGVADLANASVQYKSGDYLGAGLSLIGIVPYAGDFAKAGKIGKDIRILNSAVDALKTSEDAGSIVYRAFTKDNFRKNLVRKTGIDPKGMDAHHLLPKTFEEPLGIMGINVHNPKYGRWANHSRHNKTAQRYNKDFEQFLRSNDNVSEKEIVDFAESLMSKYGLY